VRKSLAGKARAVLQRIQADQQTEYTEPLIEYIPRVTPRWKAPTWLLPYVLLFEEALRRPIRVVVAAPPQHGKTETTTHGLVQAFRKCPGSRNAYATYNAQRCARVERKSRLIAQRDGLEMHFRQDSWLDTRTGGSLLWASRNGGLTGEPVDRLLVVDDILKDRREADSAKVREDCVDWFDDVAEPRCHPTASIIVMATRWHPEDLSGVLISRGYQHLNIKALADGPTDSDGFVIDDPLHRRIGDALCEERKTRASLLEKQKVNVFSFVSLYQGEPRPRGGTVFGEPTYYDELPSDGYRVGYGVDLAYSKRTQSDWSVCVEIWRWVPRPTPDAPAPKAIYYIKDVIRKQVRAPEFMLVLKTRRAQRIGPMRWYAYGPEHGIADFIQLKVHGLEVISASGDKFQRAQPFAEAWNEGRIRIPSRKFFGIEDDEETPEPEWVTDYVSEIQSFTGVNDSQDDQVDASSGGFDALESGVMTLPTPPQKTDGDSRWDDYGGRGFG